MLPFNNQIIRYVCERDIDLLLLEELHVSPTFTSWIIERNYGPDVRCEQLLDAFHSLRNSIHGESDLVLRFQDDQSRVSAILLENKVGALPQPDQAVRYLKRGEEGVRENQWHQFKTCIVAPSEYLLNTHDAQRYQIRISYEEIIEWFQREGSQNRRMQYKAEVIAAAIRCQAVGYQPIMHEGVSQFWIDYWQLVREEFPLLKMNKPDKKPTRSNWPMFNNPELGPGRRLIHKLSIGVVDLQISGTAKDVATLSKRWQPLLLPGMEIKITGKSLSIRCHVAPVDGKGALTQQIDAVRKALQAACSLLQISDSIAVDKQ